MKGHESSSVVSDSVTHGLYGLWNSLGQNTGVGSLSFLQGIFPTKGSNPGLLHCRQNLLPAEPQRKPKNTGVGSLSLLQWIFPILIYTVKYLPCARHYTVDEHKMVSRIKQPGTQSSNYTLTLPVYNLPLPRVLLTLTNFY